MICKYCKSVLSKEEIKNLKCNSCGCIDLIPHPLDNYKLWLTIDDKRDCSQLIARDYHSGIYTLQTMFDKLDGLYLDHDFGDMSFNGLDVCKYMCENKLFVKNVVIVSDNSVGISNIEKCLLSNGYKKTRVRTYQYDVI